MRVCVCVCVFDPSLSGTIPASSAGIKYSNADRATDEQRTFQKLTASTHLLTPNNPKHSYTHRPGDSRPHTNAKAHSLHPPPHTHPPPPHTHTHTHTHSCWLPPQLV